MSSINGLTDYETVSPRFDTRRKRYERTQTSFGIYLTTPLTWAMASSIDDGGVLEECRNCERETPHDVHIQLRTESRRTENAEYSREPYRVSQCRVCSIETVLRMNDA